MMTMNLSRNEPEEPHLQRALDVSTDVTPVQSGCRVITRGRGRDSVQAEIGGETGVCAGVGSPSVARDGQNMQLTFPRIWGFVL